VQFGQHNGSFVTTDATLHALHYIFDNLLTDLEYSNFQPMISDEILVPMLQAAHQQTAETPAELAQPAQDAELFLVVALELFKPGTRMVRKLIGGGNGCQAVSR
jgi:hypothetical protein